MMMMSAFLLNPDAAMQLLMRASFCGILASCESLLYTALKPPTM